MDPFFLPASATSPEISFEFARHHLSIRGRPGAADGAFLVPAMARLHDYLALCDGQSIDVHVALTPCGGAPAVPFAPLLDALNDAAIFGNDVRLHWYRDAEDDAMLQLCQELREDFVGLEFVDCLLPATPA